MNPDRRTLLAGLASLAARPVLADEPPRLTNDRGAIVRGPRNAKRLALAFTADRFAEGGAAILDALRLRRLPAAFFLTGRFLRDPAFRPWIARALDDGHNLGPHSDDHLLYATWDRPPRLLVSRATFLADLRANDRALDAVGHPPARFPYFLPPYEHHTEEIAAWTREAGRILINMTPGTTSHADYMEDDNPRFVPADRMVASVLDASRTPPDGLNGFLLLMHLGAGPGRTRDHLHDHLGRLLDGLLDAGYAPVRVADLLRDPSPR